MAAVRLGTRKIDHVTEQSADRGSHDMKDIERPHVAVEVETFRPFFILGEVTAPGQYAYVPNMTVETAVAIAGGFGPRAFKKKIELHRPVNGGTARVVVHPTYPLRPGDTVVVAERWF